MAKRENIRLSLGGQPLRKSRGLTRSALFSHLSASLLAGLFALGLVQFDLDGLKGLMVDALFRTQPSGSPHPDLRLVAYDDFAAERRAETSRFPAEEIAQVLAALAKDNPKAVVLLGPIGEKRYTPVELSLIGQSLAKFENAFIGYTDDESLGKNPAAELGSVRFLPGFISRDTFSYGADSVSRRVMIAIQSVPSVYAEVAQTVQPIVAFKNRTSFGGMGDSVQTYINWDGRPGTYRALSSRAVAEGAVAPGTFTGKVVLIGRALSSKVSEDFVLTPLSRSPGTTTVIEGAAHSLSTLMRNRGIAKSSRALDTLLSLFVGILTVNLALYLSPWKGILAVLWANATLLGTGWLLLFQGDYWLNLAHPLVVACVGYYLVIPYRLVEEYRKRWHYQEQTEFMAELERLKSNFLSLVTHDLKTPIARIQGHAELVLNEDVNLSEKQRTFLSAIVNTTGELSTHVETVLDLTRIESSQVPLDKSSRDINKTVEEVVESSRPLAEEKDIRLEAQLEPIFSFRYDGRLIRRVISNLVENAIKYSPAGSHIVVSSKEEGNWVHVAVTDQGVGIPPDEQSKVFAKFYRAQHSVSSEVKGTGLGLYLARYFVELHQGVINLRSEVGKGSTFTISLPV